MADQVAKVGEGNVKIVLDGKEYELVPSANAAFSLSRLSGGLQGAIDRVIKIDLDVISQVISVGLRPDDLKSIPSLQEAIYKSGMTDQTASLVSKCMDYIINLMNGGRPPSSISPP